jgi:hypothetical protein
MRCLFIFTIAAVLAVGLATTTWSQTAGGGAAGGGGGAAGASAAGGAGAAGTTGSAATAGQAGQAAQAPQAGAAPQAGRAGSSIQTGTNPPQTGTTRNLVPAGNGNRVNGRANGVNGTAGLNSNASSNNRGAFQNSGVNQTPFFNDPGVRSQLNMNDAQYNSLNQGYQNAYRRYNQSLNNLNNPNMTQQQREAQMQQLETQFNQNFDGTVNSTLNNPQTLNRYNQLNRQYQGFNAFNDPAVRKQLNLSQDQIRQFRTLSGNWRQQLQQLRQSGGQTVDPAQLTQLQQQFATQLNGVLTPEQQQMWSQQTGQAYSFGPQAYFGSQPANNSAVQSSGAGASTFSPDGSPASGTTGTGVQAGTSPSTVTPQGTTTATPGSSANPVTPNGTTR